MSRLIVALFTSLMFTPAVFAAPPVTFYPVPPCRIVDTRLILEPLGKGSPLVSGVLRDFQVRGACGVSATAVAAAVNVTAVNPEDKGHLVLFPSGTEAPTTSNLNFAAGVTTGNFGIVQLSDETPDLSVFPKLAGPVFGKPRRTHMTLDVIGYFE